MSDEYYKKENARLHAKLRDSIPMQAFREMMDYCKTGECDDCEWQDLCLSFVNDGARNAYDAIDLNGLEFWIKENRA